MGLHDKIASKASSMGKTSDEFHYAAQQHANASVFVLIVTGIVWFFTSWVWALIPASLGFYTGFKSISSTLIATRLEEFEQKKNI